MPDLTIEYMQECAQMHDNGTMPVGNYVVSGLFSERHYPVCTCPAYKWGKRTVNFGGRMMPPICKHIEQAQKSVCTWHQQYSDEVQTEKGICPRCGGKTRVVRVGV